MKKKNSDPSKVSLRCDHCGEDVVPEDAREHIDECRYKRAKHAFVGLPTRLRARFIREFANCCASCGYIPPAEGVPGKSHADNYDALAQVGYIPLDTSPSGTNGPA